MNSADLGQDSKLIKVSDKIKLMCKIRSQVCFAFKEKSTFSNEVLFIFVNFFLHNFYLTFFLIKLENNFMAKFFI
jgi:hypothetical protein